MFLCVSMQLLNEFNYLAKLGIVVSKKSVIRTLQRNGQ